MWKRIGYDSVPWIDSENILQFFTHTQAHTHTHAEYSFVYHMLTAIGYQIP
jgi:hypothetical protein